MENQIEIINENQRDVELLEISHNPRLNLLLLKSLKKWRFEASNQALTQIINVKFAVN